MAIALVALDNRRNLQVQTFKSCQLAQISCKALANIFHHNKMGEVKPVKMDNWAPTDSATLFADGKALTLTLSSGFSKYLFL